MPRISHYNIRVSSSAYTWFFLGIAFAFFLLKVLNIAPKISDENIYFYDAHLMAKGILPFKDFFLASLPGQLIPLAILIKLFGFNLFLLKLVPILASIGSAWIIYKITSSLNGGQASSRNAIGGIIASTLFLFSFSVLVSTDHGTGVHEATFFLLLSWYLLSKEKSGISNLKFKISNCLWAGLALFVGLTVRVYILPSVIALVAWYILSRKLRTVLVFLAAGIIPYLIANFTLYKIFGEDFLAQAWKYHFLKTTGIDKLKIFSYFLTNEWILVFLFVLTLIVVFVKILKDKEVSVPPHVAQACLMLIAQLGFYLVFADIYYLYLVMVVPFLAVISGFGVSTSLSTSSRISYKFLVGGLGLFIVLNSYNYLTNHAPTSRLTEIEKIITDTKALTKPGDTIYGTFGVVPLVAARTGLEITENQVDTNAKRYLTGLLSSEKATEYALESKIFIQLAYIDPSTNQIMKLDPDFVTQRKIQDNCKLIRTYPVPKDYDNNAILLWVCKLPK